MALKLELLLPEGSMLTFLLDLL